MHSSLGNKKETLSKKQTNKQTNKKQRIPQRYSLRKATPTHIIVSFTEVEMKENMLRAAREKVRLPTKGSPSD